MVSTVNSLLVWGSATVRVSFRVLSAKLWSIITVDLLHHLYLWAQVLAAHWSIHVSNIRMTGNQDSFHENGYPIWRRQNAPNERPNNPVMILKARKAQIARLFWMYRYGNSGSFLTRANKNLPTCYSSSRVSMCSDPSNEGFAYPILQDNLLSQLYTISVQLCVSK